MVKSQRQQIERMEAQQEAELRLSSKRIRAEQVSLNIIISLITADILKNLNH